MAFAMPYRWPGDTRPLYVRALEERAEDQRVLKARILTEAKQLCGRKGGLQPKPPHYNRKHPEVTIGARFGSWVVLSILTRAAGVSKVRLTLRCDCGRRKEAYDYNARLHHGPCPHPARARSRRDAQETENNLTDPCR